MRFERMRNRDSSPIRRVTADRAFTLVELLVVIVLISTLVATAIPVLAPGGDERRLREASRSFNAYIQGAQSRAIQTGRPFGIALRRLSEDTRSGADNAVVTRVEYVETPPAFAGFDSSSVARIVSLPSPSDPRIRQLGLQLMRYAANGLQATGGRVAVPAGYSPGLMPDAFVRPGDTFQLGGASFTIDNPLLVDAGLQPWFATLYGPDTPFPGYFQAPAGGATLLLPILAADGIDPDLRFSHYNTLSVDSVVDLEMGVGRLGDVNVNSVYFATQPQSFKVIRQPVAAAAEPFELPAGTAIDLQASIFGNGVRLYDPGWDYNEGVDEFVIDTRPIMILFSPDGGIDSVTGIQQVRQPDTTTPTEPGPVFSSLATTSLALLVGRRDQIPGDPTLRGGTATQFDYRFPIDLRAHVAAANLTEIEARELTDQFNWLNLESRWVVLGAQSGTTAPIENSSPILPAGNNPFQMTDQLGAALQNAPARLLAGGR